MTPNELIGIASNNISDGGMVLLAREEYLAFVNDVAMDVWTESKAMHKIRQYTLPAGARTFEVPDIDIIYIVTMQVRRGTPPAEGEPEAEAYDPSESPIHVQEKSIDQNLRQGFGSYENQGQERPNTYVTLEFRNGRHVVHSPQPFESGSILHLQCVIHSSRYNWLDTDAENFEETLDNSIWEPLRNAFIEGVTWRAARRALNYAKDPMRQQIMRDAQNLYYNRYLPMAVRYINGLKDLTSAMYIEPFSIYTDE